MRTTFAHRRREIHSDYQRKSQIYYSLARIKVDIAEKSAVERETE